MNVMLLTAGEGTRLRPHTLYSPKPVIPFLNVPLYAYPLQLLRSVKVKKVIMNTFHLPQKLKSAVTTYPQPYPVFFSEEKVLLGSGGGIGHTRTQLQSESDFIVMNGDEVIIPQDSDVLKKAVLAHKASRSIATLLVMEHSEVGTKFGGVWVGDRSQILGFGKEKIKQAAKGFHYIGVAIFSERIFKYIKDGESNILYDGLTQAIAEGHSAEVFPISCQWFETGNEADFKSATGQCLKAMAQKTKISKYLMDLISYWSPNSRFTNKDNRLVLADSSVTFDISHFSGYNVLGEGLQLKKGCRLKNCILGPRVQIKNADQLENMMIFNELDVY